jgi:hypothetical protein
MKETYLFNDGSLSGEGALVYGRADIQKAHFHLLSGCNGEAD